VIPNFAFNKAVLHEFEQSCSAIGRRKSWEQEAQKKDEDEE